jgi:hypothetical protein
LEHISRVDDFFATIAISIVNADRASAFRAGPSNLFIRNEFPNSTLFDVFKILNHAHTILGPVSLVQMLQASTRIAFTLKAIFCFGTPEEYTCFDFAPTTSDEVVNACRSTAITIILLP